MEFIDIAAIVGAATASTLIAVFWIAKTGNTAKVQVTSGDREHDQEVAFLFEDDRLHHASETAEQMYRLIPGRDTWAAMRAHFVNRFPNLPETPSDTGSETVVVTARDLHDAATLCLSRDGAFTRLSMHDAVSGSHIPHTRIEALQRELADLKRASDTTPHAVWQLDSQGEVTWYNAAYAGLYRKVHKIPPQADRPVFDVKPDESNGSGVQRVSVDRRNNSQKDWYDVSAASVGDITIFHAVDVNAIVKSEVAQRNFVQTLAKTFAQLSIGLAIFDRNGRLALFNPALIDLTELPADFLSGRPTLMSFFDRIRENRKMPEPKNYASWRQEIAEVISAATDGRYQETWTLETGQTYRVNGRPHPDGAIAFLIEDISAEVSLTRNFRAELELGQSLMDTFDDALVVFSSSGVLTFCNLAYRELWSTDPDNSFADTTIADAVEIWRSACKPDTDWDALEEFILEYGDKSSWEMIVSLQDETPVTCKITRITSGATVLRFVRLSPVSALPTPNEITPTTP